MDKEQKIQIMTNYGHNEKDTGATEVQVAILTERIKHLTDHLATNRHDFHTQRDLFQLVGKRRRLLSYLSREDVGRYNKLIKSLGLRK